MRPGMLSREEQPWQDQRGSGQRGQAEGDPGKGLGAKGTHNEKGRDTCLCKQRWDSSLWAPTTIPYPWQAPIAKNSCCATWICG